MGKFKDSEKIKKQKEILKAKGEQNSPNVRNFIPAGKTRKIKKRKMNKLSKMQIEGPEEAAPKEAKYKTTLESSVFSQKPKAELLRVFKTKFDAHKKLFESGKRLSKGQKKRLEIKQHFLRQKYFKEFIDFQKNEGKTRQISLKEFEGALDLIEGHPKKELVLNPGHNLSEKKRHEIQGAEVKRCQQIANLPQFKANPLEAMKLHLLNTLGEK